MSRAGAGFGHDDRSENDSQDDRRDRDREPIGPSKADESDDWGKDRQFVAGGGRSGGGFGGHGGGGFGGDRGGFGAREGSTDRYPEPEGSRADGAATWGNKQFVPSGPPKVGGFEDRPSRGGYEERKYDFADKDPFRAGNSLSAGLPRFCHVMLQSRWNTGLSVSTGCCGQVSVFMVVGSLKTHVAFRSDVQQCTGCLWVNPPVSWCHCALWVKSTFSLCRCCHVPWECPSSDSQVPKGAPDCLRATS
jgi:hypothetical protein